MGVDSAVVLAVNLESRIPGMVDFRKDAISRGMDLAHRVGAGSANIELLTLLGVSLVGPGLSHQE